MFLIIKIKVFREKNGRNNMFQPENKLQIRDVIMFKNTLSYFSAASRVFSNCKPDSNAKEVFPSKLVKCNSGFDVSDMSLLSSVLMSTILKFQISQTRRYLD